MAQGWEYILARSSDMSVLGKFKNAHDRTLETDINKSGSASCWTPMSERLARLAIPWKTCLIAQYDGTWYWSGPIASRQTDMAGNRVAISAIGWFDRLMHFFIEDLSVSYTEVDAGAIITALLAKAAAQDAHLPITMGTVELSQPRTITYNLDQNIGQAIQDLAEIEAGIDWYIDPITRQINVYARRGVDRPKCKWNFIGDGKSQQSNLSNCVELLDGSTLVNDITPRGKYASGHDEDLVSQTDYGVFQERPSLSDVIEPERLNEYAVAEIVYRSQPRLTYILTPKPSSKATVPKLFRDFDIGDIGYLTARREFIDVQNQAVRMFGASLSINDVGVETITNLQTTAG